MSADAIATLLQGAGPLTPSRLIEVFCKPERVRAFPRSRRDEDHRCSWHAGSCAYDGKDSYADGVDGFDDGTVAWAELTASGWTLLQDPGSRQFPHTFQMRWRPREAEVLQAASEETGARGVKIVDRLDRLRETADGRWCVLHFQAGDFGIVVYDDEPAYRIDTVGPSSRRWAA